MRGSNTRAFVNELVAAVAAMPQLDAPTVDACCDRAYRRLAGSGLSGDDRLFRAMHERHEENLAHLRETVGAMNDNVVRMVEHTRRTLIDSGALDFVERNRRQIEQFNEMYTRVFRPAHLDQIARLNRHVEQILRPPVVDQLTRPDSALNVFARGYARVAENLARQLRPVVRPAYFGGLEGISKQINDALRPAPIEATARLAEQLRETIRPQYVEDTETHRGAGRAGRQASLPRKGAATNGLARWWYDRRKVPRQQIVAASMDALWLGVERLREGERWRTPRAKRS